MILLHLINRRGEVDSVSELRTKEGQHIELIMSSLNKSVAGRSMKQHQIDNKEALISYRRVSCRRYRKDNNNTLRNCRTNYFWGRTLGN